MRLLLVPLLLFGLPLAEIAGFVIVGRWLGLWSTLALVVLSSVVGILFLRAQGLSVLRQINTEGREGRVPGEAIVSGAMIVVAAILLILPGFLTDIIGLLLFIPGVRRLIWRQVGQRVVVRTSRARGGYPDPSTRPAPSASQNPAPGAAPQTIDLDSTDYQRKSGPSSPWSDRPTDDR
jgi:UPF0716 protein FxsA